MTNDGLRATDEEGSRAKGGAAGYAIIEGFGELAQLVRAEES